MSPAADRRHKDLRAGLPRLPLLGEGKRGPEGYLTYLLRQANASVRLALDRVLAKEDMTYPQQLDGDAESAIRPPLVAGVARLASVGPQNLRGIRSGATGCATQV